MSTTQAFTLNTGASIPAIGCGGWGGTTPEARKAFKSVVVSALQAGYTHIDGAWLYLTEEAIGEGIRESGIPRENIFLTTKLPLHHEGKVKEYFDESLQRLGVEYVDLYLIHWPISLEYYDANKNILPERQDGKWKTRSSPTFNEIWAEMEKIYASGKAKAIGVSNFSVKTLEKLLTTAKVIPAVNQVELHPYLVQQDLVDYCKGRGIHVTAYTPTGRANVHEEPVLKELAKKYNASPVQIIFAWHNARGVSIATQSRNEERRKEALHLPKLDQADVERVSALDRQQMSYTPLDANGTIYGWTLEQFGWEHLKPATKGFL